MRWKIKNKNIDQSNLVQEIYQSRGINNYLELFALNEDDLYDPYAIHDMKKAVDRIMKAIENKEKIIVYGDYDVDGITSTYVLYDVLLELGAQIDYDIPNRFIDGYGLNVNKAFDIINDDYNLVITVDNGIKSVKEANIFKNHGVDFIITDHHEPETPLPNAYAILHTNLSDYPFKQLAGVGVAFKLAQALIGDKALDYIDIVALGTISDMMPLIDENRAIVNLGLQQLKSSRNIGLAKLVDFLDLSAPSVSDVQYKIAPRINACGRMKSAKLAVKLLTSSSHSKALMTIREMEEINSKRKKLTTILFEEALHEMDNNESAIIVHSPRMHEGVLGIVASRLANEYGKVAVVLKEDELTFKGSIRSYNGVDVIDVLHQLEHLFLRYGGHQNAAGLEFKKEYLTTFKQAFSDLIPEAKRTDMIEAEAIIDIETLEFDQIADLDRYDLKDTLFVFEPLSIRSKYLIKGEHTKLILDAMSEAIFFNNKALYQHITKYNKVSLLGRLDLNTFHGRTKKQIIIEDYQINQ